MAVVAGVVGWFMVLRAQTFAGHTLSVVGFPGAAGAVWLGVQRGARLLRVLRRAARCDRGDPPGRPGARFSEESAVIGTVQAFALACGCCS